MKIKFIYEAIIGVDNIKRYAVMNALYIRTKLKLVRQNFALNYFLISNSEVNRNTQV